MTWKLISLATLTRQSGDCPFTGEEYGESVLTALGSQSAEGVSRRRGSRRKVTRTNCSHNSLNERQTGVDDLSRGEDERARVIEWQETQVAGPIAKL